MKPVIGITVDAESDPNEPRTKGKLSLNWNYAEAIARSGAVPILIPPMADPVVIAALIDGWLIPGGLDIDARRFGEENHPKVELQNPVRFEAEKGLLDMLDPATPILGICYGCQFLNVARGGSLIQHLPDVVGHEGHTGGTLQNYSLEDSRLKGSVGVEFMAGKSYHHQAVRELGDNLKVVARAEDGTIEGVEATDRSWVIGVQWHPERTLEDRATQALFANFVAAARQHALRRTVSNP